MNKIMTLIALILLSNLAFSLNAPGNGEPRQKERDSASISHRPEQRGARNSNFEKERKAQEQKIKAMQEKMTLLVQEYKQETNEKKKIAKKGEITALVSSIREEQLSFQEKQLEKFSQRLEKMQNDLAFQKQDYTKREWINQKTENLIDSDGDLKVLFDRNELMDNEKGPRRPNKGPEMREPNGPRRPPLDTNAHGKPNTLPNEANENLPSIPQD